MKKLTDIEKAENKILCAYLDYYNLIHMDPSDEEDIQRIEAWLNQIMFRDCTDVARERRKKVMKKYIDKQQA